MTPPSLWHDQIVVEPHRPGLEPGRHAVDVAIVGAGFTGLWTAFHIQRLDPSLSIAIVEAETVGFGASGRNGGWCIAELAADHARWSELSNETAATALDVALHETVDQIEATITDFDIACDFKRGGEIHLARNGGQEARLKMLVDDTSNFWLDRQDAVAMCGATGVRGALFIPSTAALHPAKLARALGHLVEQRGATIYENTRATAVSPGCVLTADVRLTARHVVLATEGYTATLANRKRQIVPLSSMMVATEPLPADVLDEIGLHDRPVFTDGRFVVIYGQRTADNRLAFGGRTAPYKFGSQIPTSYASSAGVEACLYDLFPALRHVEITHRWGGVLGVTRNWTPSVTLDADKKLLTAGGYVGEGVAATHLAGRILGAAIADPASALLSLPLVRSASRPWPVEPFRWTGIAAGSRLFDAADLYERRTGRPARWAGVVAKGLRR